MPESQKNIGAGLPSDPAMLKVMTEIDIIAHLAENEFARILPDGVTPAQYGVLNHLLRLDVQETISELAHGFQVAQPTMSSTVRKLEEKGFVELIPDADDRRIKRVSITRKGSGIRQKAVKSLEPYWTAFEAAAPGLEWDRILPALTMLRQFLDKRRSARDY